MSQLLSVETLSKSYPTPGGRLHVLGGVSFSLAPGRMLALTGESGSGKSTLLHLVGGLDRPDSGSVRLAGTEIAALPERARARLRRERIGIVFQQFNLVPSLSVADNLSLQARLAGRHDPAWEAELAERLGLGETLARYPEQLSGGQQQRLAIGRALAARPALLLADEPTGNLDEHTAGAVMALTRALVTETGAALLMVTHSMALAATLDERLHLSGGQLSHRAAAA
ncbi:MAG: ATP-binding cassette domain-containing protein [Pseudomonadota bacterium]